MITVKMNPVKGVLLLDRAMEMLKKYDSPLISSAEDFNGRSFYSYVTMIQFKTEEEVVMFMIEASFWDPKVRDLPFEAGHTPF